MPKQPARPHPDEIVPVNYERFFVPTIGRPAAVDLLRAANLRPGQRVLDVGCGTGIVTRLAAELVAPDGAVVGLDISPGMLAVARSVTPVSLGVSWYEANAESQPFPDEAFDVVLCQMSLPFVPDRLAALREMHRVLVGGGRLVLNVPGAAAPLFETLATAMGRHIAPEAQGFVETVFSMREPGDLAHLLQDAGFHDIEITEETKDLTLPPAQDFLWQYVSSTPLAEVVAAADASALGALEQDVIRGWKDYEIRDGMDCEQGFVIATARK